MSIMMIAIRQQLRWQLLEMRWWSVDKYIDVDEKKDEEWKEEKYLKKKQEETKIKEGWFNSTLTLIPSQTLRLQVEDNN